MNYVSEMFSFFWRMLGYTDESSIKHTGVHKNSILIHISFFFQPQKKKKYQHKSL